MTTAPKQLAALLVAHAQLVPSLTNPRKRFDRDRLEELALSMAPPVGILEPLVVRRLAVERAVTMKLNPPDQFFEIIAGERRWRAAAIAKIDELPVVVRDIPDDQVIRLQLVENKNREDVHPLDEAEAMDRLLRINKAETPKTIAASIGMSERYVQNRLHYLRLVPEVKEAFRSDVITAGHVDLLMRLPADEQTRAFKNGLYDERFDYDEDAEKNTKHLELRSVRGLGDWIAGHVRLPLDTKSPQLELLPDVAQAVTESAAPGAPTLVELSDSYSRWEGKGPAPLLRGEWTPVKKGETCASQVRGVIVIGRKRGTILTVCTGVGVCKKHFPHSIKEKPRPSEPGVSKPKSTGNDASDHAKAEKKRDEENLRKAREREKRLHELWEHVVDKVAPKVMATTAPPLGAVLRLVDWNQGGGGNHVRTLRDLVLAELGNMGSYALREYAKVAAILKPLGIDLAAIEKQLFPPDVVGTKKTAPKAMTKRELAAAKKRGDHSVIARPKKKRKAGAKK